MVFSQTELKKKRKFAAKENLYISKLSDGEFITRIIGYCQILNSYAKACQKLPHNSFGEC